MENLAYLNGKPTVSAIYKKEFTDFVVKEDLGFEPDGEGEHVLVYLRKCNCNTQFVAEQLAKFAGISTKLVSYAGLKDRQAVTEQWFGLHMPGKSTPDFSLFQLAGCEILKVTRQLKKLRVGVLKGNFFSIILREVSDKNTLQQRIESLARKGAPNYFGEQRFGRDNANVTQAILWANGKIKVKERQKRSFYLSAARSTIFNDIVSARILQEKESQVMLGDALQLTGRGSWFVATQADLSDLQHRFERDELRITAPMVGDGELGTHGDAEKFERSCLDKWQTLLELLKTERVATTRRAILLKPEQLSY
ncbi:MAG: tRNA pseudouridine(13) synthase TruD, partial [Candidatus Schmidhempelia sp.]|nr:tRNA pseudouridine(13) synthase TruD [Candidatus Schmidhempelia sp.]